MRMKLYSKFLVFLYSLFLSPLLANQQNTILNKIEKNYKQSGVGAVAFVLVENGKLVTAGGFGQYSHRDKTKVDQHSLFKIGSITKTFTAIAVMQQVEKGKLTLSQPIKSILNKIPLINPYKHKPVTLAMLLEHTSGLQDLNRKEFNYPTPLSLTEAFKVAPEARRIKTPPGYQYNYSNAGAGYLGRAIEVVNRVDYDDWFETEILAKMGMKNSSLRWSQKTESQLVTGYDSDLTTPIPYWHTLFRPFGGMNTTALDMANLLQIFTAPRDASWNQIISLESIQRMEHPTTSLASKAGLSMGYGLAIRNEIYRGHRLFGHGGDGDGYLAQFSYSKESGRGYFFVMNAFRHDIDRRFSRDLDNWLIEDLETVSYPKKHYALSEKQLKAITGEYQISTSRFIRKNRKSSAEKLIRLNNHFLQICNKTQTVCEKLEPHSANLFYSAGDVLPSTVIIKADDGNTYMQHGNTNYRLLN